MSQAIVSRWRCRTSARLLAAVVLVCGPLGACAASRSPASKSAIPRALREQARPIGRGVRFHPPTTGRTVGRCTRTLGPRSSVHVEVFAANRVVILPAGIGVRSPAISTAGRVSHARCYGALVTLEPTGVVLVRRGLRLRVADLFKAWGQPLSSRRVASFSASGNGTPSVFVDGKRRQGAPGGMALTPGAEIVIEVGPHVPPHSSYTFPPGP